MTSGPAAGLQISNNSGPTLASLTQLSKLDRPHDVRIVQHQYRTGTNSARVSVLAVVQVFEVAGSNPNRGKEKFVPKRHEGQLGSV